MTQVPSLSIFLMFIDIIIGITVYLLSFIIMHKKIQCKYRHFFIGSAVFVVAALLIEGSLNALISHTHFFKSIYQSHILLSIYGGLMAGIFEESGRLFAFSVLLKKDNDNYKTSLMYGLGHGAIEVLFILSINMISNLVLAVAANKGLLDEAVKASPELMLTVNKIAEVPSRDFLITILERFITLILQTGLSVTVWYSVKNKAPLFFILAIIIHALADILTKYFSLSNISLVWIHLVLTVITLGTALLAVHIIKKDSNLNSLKYKSFIGGNKCLKNI